MKPSLVVVCGPTASGKSAISLELAKRFAGEILNADSVQIYKGFDIGSAKPTVFERTEVRHHLISEFEPNQELNAGIFRELAKEAIGKLHEQGTLPFVVGGTGLYIRSLLCGLVSTEFDDEQEFQGAEEEELTFDGESSSYEQLQKIDPISAAKLHPNDTARIRRALEVKLKSGRSLATLQEKHAHQECEFRALVCILLPQREELYAKIDRRVEQMLAEGLVDEVEKLVADHDPSLKPFKTIGYRHVLSFLRSEVSYEEMVEIMKRDTRRLAKRQYTWWRHQPEKLSWRNVTDLCENRENRVNGETIVDKVSQIIKEFLLQKQIFTTEGIDFLVINDLELSP